ncbi:MULTISPECIES: TIGR02391 family protein [unclassified Microbacterium]|uniref:TIGR02391 family protein n=1 Tax=unclassified Microbacterium TaxID=2609290 RepID=UPI003464F0F5
MDVDWAIEQLRRYLHLTERVALPPAEQASNRKTRKRGEPSEIAAAAHVVEAISLAVYGEGRRWIGREHAEKLLWELTDGATVRQKLGLSDPGPSIEADRLHPWVWEAAEAHWRSGNHRAAVWAASVNVNSRTQGKVNNSRLSESKLLQEVFGLDDPAPGRPRLRLTGGANPELFKDVHLGASALGRGLYAAVRNPINHVTEEAHGLSETEALEALAGFSLLSRWIDRAEVVSVDEVAHADTVESRTPLLDPQ